ncbi:MAG: hypothetical protein GEU93_15185 [Propionibacteriales bacterium]|nr:hypothetical protein [Propionibacteriales bacterium]
MRPYVVSVVVIAAVVAGGAGVSALPSQRDAVRAAVGVLPAETLNAGVTDWVRARELLAAEHLSSDSPERAIRAFLREAYDADVSANSLLADAAPAMVEHFGWSVLDADWEALAQSRRGAAAVVQFPEEFDLQRVRDGLARLGYVEPAVPSGVWAGGADLVTRIESSLTPMLGYVAVLDDTHQIVLSDRQQYAGRAARTVTGEIGSLDDVAGMSDVAASLVGSTSAIIRPGGLGCAEMGFGDASPDARALAERRIAQVGGLHPYQSVGLGLVAEEDRPQRAQDLVVAMHFDGVPLAEARRRAMLATGDAPAQGGVFESRFRVGSVRQQTGDVVLTLRPRGAETQLMSDYANGQLLFASCGRD